MTGEAAIAQVARRENDRLALDAWEQRRRERLACEPQAVRAEILSEARDRQCRDGRILWTARDSELCRMRVLSRARLRRFGAIPDGREWQRQIEEVREALGLDPRVPP